MPTTDLYVGLVSARFWPVLRALADAGGALHRRELIDRVATTLGLTAEQRELRIPSGKATIHAHRTGWSLQHLKHAGLVVAQTAGIWGLTEVGRAFIAERPGGLSDADMAMLKRATRPPSDGQDVSTSTEPSIAEARAVDPDLTTSPEEQIERALADLRRSIAEQLLERLLAGTPSFFERVVQELVSKMGYGSVRDDLRRVVGSGDGGIDGIISLDRLGLEKVYVQAKRWQNPVGRPEIQGFFGALHGRHANKGVFITTSSFTREARDFATNVSDTLVLVDGPTLAALMIEFGVGVTLRPVYMPDIDSDYFVDD